MRRSTITALVLATAMGLAVPALAQAPVVTTGWPASARCASGEVDDAAVAVFGTGTEVVRTDLVAGLAGALVLEPRIAPGTRARLLAVGDRWCEATSTFNVAWAASGRSTSDGHAVATAYAQLAAAPYFDGVAVTDVHHAAAGTYTLTTHARTNGVTADWTIVTDGSGVRSATWTVTAFAVPPLEAEIEGLTALPGGTETYTRALDGLLVPLRGLPTPETARASSAPRVAEYEAPDGFRITISMGDTRVALDPGLDTGVRRADVVREFLGALAVNYEEFHSWGFRQGWAAPDPVSGAGRGYMYINDTLSLYCMACVFISDDFQIHMISEVEVAMSAFGYEYPDGPKSLANIVGHEMFHNFQLRYIKPGFLNGANRAASSAYLEGTARAQEALHSYSEVSHQPRSLVYSGARNGCNGFTLGNADSAMATGVFDKTYRTYNACYFWLSWYSAEGTEGLRRLVADSYPAVSPVTDTDDEGVAALGLAGSTTVADQLARFAGAAITHRGYELTGADGQRLDWAKHLDRWAPYGLAAGDTREARLGASGVMAREVEERVHVTLADPGAATLFVVVDDGESTTTRTVPGGAVTVDPADGRTWVGAARSQPGTAVVRLVASAP